MCDSLCVLGPRTSRGHALFAKNSDRPTDEAQDLEWHPPRHDRSPVEATYIPVAPHAGETLGVLGSRPRWMWGFEHGVNEAGLAVGNEAIWTTDNPAAHPDALVGMDLVRLALERSLTARSGVEVIADLLEQYGQGGSGHEGGARPYWSSFLLCDPAEAFVVDTSGRELAVEAVDGARAISNRPSIADFDERLGLRHPRIDARVDARWATSRALVARPAVGVDDLRAHLRTHEGDENGWTVCMHADDEATTAGIVAELATDAPRIAHVILGQPCASIFVPVVIGHPLGTVPPWERFAALAEVCDPAATSDIAELERALAAEVRADADWNAEAWRRVTGLLDGLVPISG